MAPATRRASPVGATNALDSCPGIGLGGAAGIPGAGSGSLPLAIPAGSAVRGVSLNFQGWLVDGSAATGLSITSAVQVSIR